MNQLHVPDGLSTKNFCYFRCDEQYGGTRLLFLDYVKIQGIEIDFVDSTNLKAVEGAIKSNTKVKKTLFRK